MLLSRFGRAHPSRRALWILVCLTTATVSTARAQSTDPKELDLLCPLVEHERRRVLEDVQFKLELLENEYRARQIVFDMLERLWAARAIEQEAYLDYKRLRDRTRVRIARATTQVSQQSSIAEQYALICGVPRRQSPDQIQEKIDKLQAEYRRLDCELLTRDWEIAEIDHKFDQAVLESTRTLADSNIKSKYELVIDEYDLSQSKARVESYRARATICKKRLVD